MGRRQQSFEEMKAASLLGKLRTMDAAAMVRGRCWEMAIGALELGLADEIAGGGQAGRLHRGRHARRGWLRFLGQAVANIHHNLVHAVRGGDATSVIAGQVVVENGRLVNADLDELIGRVRDLVPDLFRRRSDYLAAAETLPAQSRRSDASRRPSSWDRWWSILRSIASAGCDRD